MLAILPLAGPATAQVEPESPPPIGLADADRLYAGPADSAYLWLEDAWSEPVLDWAEARSRGTVDQLSSAPVYDSILAEIRAGREANRFTKVTDAPGPAVVTGPWANRFQGGLWLRQPADAYRAGAEEWTPVLNLGARRGPLSRGDAIESVECLPPDYERCLLLLSTGGRRRILALREYDAARREFVADGFNLDEARTTAFWRDSSSIYITTRSVGWADEALVWSRGQTLEDARVLLEAHAVDRGLNFERRGDRILLLHAHHQHDIEYYLVQGDELLPLPVPRDSRDLAFVDGQLVLQLRFGWAPAGIAFPPGSVIGIGLEELLAGAEEFEPIMRSSPELAIDQMWAGSGTLVVRALNDVRPRLYEFTRRDGDWQRRRLDAPATGNLQVARMDDSGRYYFSHRDFLDPTTAYLRTISGEIIVGGRTAPAFDASPYQVDQWFATSADGTRVPYFVVRRSDMPMDGGNPVVIRGYGGNGISVLPHYLGGKESWLRRGGVHVIANIRGGGEYGPQWHYAVRRDRRQGAFDDFQAVAQDLVERGVTAPKMIGIEGGSNGGILVSMSFIQRPDLYGAVWANNGVLELRRCSSMSGDPPVGERGDGQNREHWAWMRTYSPFHNVEAEEPYPPLLLTTNRGDDIVHPCHSRKFAVKLEELGYRGVFYYETEDGGHGKAYTPEEEAMIITFFLSSLHPDYR